MHQPHRSIRNNGRVTQEQPEAYAPEPNESRSEEVVVRRSPRYYRFMGVGAILGIIVALVATLAFSESEDYSRFQVFGFVTLFVAPAFIALAALVALIIDARSRSVHVVADHETARSSELQRLATPVSEESSADSPAAATQSEGTTEGDAPGSSASHSS